RSSLAILGSVQARGGRGGMSTDNPSGGGGRVLLQGILGLFVAGTTTPPSAFTTGIDLSSLTGTSFYVDHGWIPVEPRLTFVQPGESLDLGAPVVLQTPSISQPGV